MEFAIKYDDGKILGPYESGPCHHWGIPYFEDAPFHVSSNKQLKVANDSLVPEIPPPEELFKVPNNRIIGLLIDPHKLNEIRIARLKAMGLGDTANYADLRRIEEELDYARAIMQRLHCMIINVSNRAIEETASLILEYLRKNFDFEY